MKRYDPSPIFDRLDALGMSREELARRLGCHDSTIRYWKTKGIGENYIDEASVAVGRTPGELWPEWLDDQIARDEATRREMSNARQRRARSGTSGYGERQRAAARRYKAENAEYIKAYDRAYYAANREQILARKRGAS